jgi:hypothetical protein
MSEDEYRFLVEQIYRPPADVPPGNVTLLHKYEADIKRYAMGGLEWIGL